MIFKKKLSVLTKFLYLSENYFLIPYSTSAYFFLGTLFYFGKISNKRPLNKGISSATNFERFISLKDLIRSISSSLSLSYLFVLPAVLKTDNIFLKPKS